MLIDDPVKEEGMLRGDLLPFEELFKLHQRRVYAVCLRMTGNTAEAEDLLQEVFIQVFRKLGSFRGESAFTTWLHRLTVNHVLMHFRKRRSRKEQLTEDGELPEQVIKSRKTSFPILDRIALNEAILKLAPGYRTVFVLHDVEGLQHLEIANLLGCSVGTSKSQLHKARMKMRRLLRQATRPSQTATTSTIVKPNLEDLSPERQTLQAILPLAA
ncbi:MAG TPA: RNA polymerase sigma factor [Pyrinomonadaceae bacterium]|jgi:RNA polymerase sigma factor, sigma-70 family|nr:RNA polymerase sigma factor [Pyrinomonadaceae bacterium]